jgi:Transmembrane Fragile-X-F protein
MYTGGVSFGGLLLLLFVTLKLTDQIGWSWWWVLSPVWIPLGVSAVCFVLAGVFLIVGAIVNHRREGQIFHTW